MGRPGWTALRDGARPHGFVAEPGEWQHGWQYFASSSLEHHFRENVVLAQSSAGNQAHLRSHSGHGSSSVLCGCPTSPEFQIQPSLFRTIVLERLRLPLQITEAVCECGAWLDRCGRHRAACPRSGRLRSRAVATETTLARVCREPGATVRRNVKLRDMWTSPSGAHSLLLELLAPTQRSPMAPCCIARVRTKRRSIGNCRCHLIVVALETGGRWGDEAVAFIDSLASARSRAAIPVLRGSAYWAWRKRWVRMLAISCARAFASSLISSPADMWTGTDGPTPDMADLFGES